MKIRDMINRLEELAQVLGDEVGVFVVDDLLDTVSEPLEIGAEDTDRQRAVFIIYRHPEE
jgi:hypothetical protein